ncbi:hypothetical protein U0070_002149 [Myodes glareolus]|uniref:Uncharacterized protein n=1 Tax=Myodes glareolus TaxID=447135 RepID=A0AAW0JPL8_MYOGA
MEDMGARQGLQPAVLLPDGLATQATVELGLLHTLMEAHDVSTELPLQPFAAVDDLTQAVQLELAQLRRWASRLQSHTRSLPELPGAAAPEGWDGSISISTGLVLDLEQAGEASTNHVSEFVGLYVQQKCSLSNHITGVKEHSVHLNESTADKTTGPFAGWASQTVLFSDWLRLMVLSQKNLCSKGLLEEAEAQESIAHAQADLAPKLSTSPGARQAKAGLAVGDGFVELTQFLIAACQVQVAFKQEVGILELPCSVNLDHSKLTPGE